MSRVSDSTDKLISREYLYTDGGLLGYEERFEIWIYLYESPDGSRYKKRMSVGRLGIIEDNQ